MHDSFQALTGIKGHSMKTMLRDLQLQLDGRRRNIAKFLQTLAQPAVSKYPLCKLSFANYAINTHSYLHTHAHKIIIP